MKLYPENDLVFKVTLKKVNETTGKTEPLIAGTVGAFISTSNLPTATAAHAQLVVTPTHLGSGVWLILFDASILDYATINPIFGSGATPYLIVTVSGAIRAVQELEYTPTRVAG